MIFTVHQFAINNDPCFYMGQEKKIYFENIVLEVRKMLIVHDLTLQKFAQASFMLLVEYLIQI